MAIVYIITTARAILIEIGHPRAIAIIGYIITRRYIMLCIPFVSLRRYRELRITILATRRVSRFTYKYSPIPIKPKIENIIAGNTRASMNGVYTLLPAIPILKRRGNRNQMSKMGIGCREYPIAR